jgi:hypothetical protein
MTVENFTDPDFRGDIRGPLPTDLKWYLAEVEKTDIDSMYILSSGNWDIISNGTFRVKDVVRGFELGLEDRGSAKIINDIRDKIAFLESGNVLDSKLIAVTHDDALCGPFTLIEGNHRSIAFTYLETLVGSTIYIGVSSLIRDYSWACKSYQA